MDRRPFGPRWWLLASMAFAVINVVLSPLAMGLFWGMLIAVFFGGSPLPGQVLVGIVGIASCPRSSHSCSTNWEERMRNARQREFTPAVRS